MPILRSDSDEIKRIDGALQKWRQGDVALDEQWFFHAGDASEPLTTAAAMAVEAGPQALPSEVAGLAVVTQTCDIVRDCLTRPYVEVAPIVHIADLDDFVAVQRGRRPALATLSKLVPHSLAIDLDRVMTVEKSIVATWKRTPGCVTDSEGRLFAQALARKRARFAFPDDFTGLAKRLQGRLTEKHAKKTDEGRGLQALREIRVHASPSWDANTVALFFWFVRHDTDAYFEGKNWADLLEQWLNLVPATGRFSEVEGQVVTLERMTAADYVVSDPLDLDHLSSQQSTT